MTRANLHGCLVVLGETGVLVTGPSGAGKTMLALRLVDHCLAHRVFARMVSDDQVLVSAAGSRLVGRPPTAIAGLAEARGLGPAPLAHEPAAVVDLVVRLVAAAYAPRLQDAARIEIGGIALPCIEMPQGQVERALIAVAARLRLPPFGSI